MSNHTRHSLLLLTYLGACGQPDAGSTDVGSTAPDTTSEGTADTLADSTGAGDAPFACVDPDFTVQVPLAGPGYDPQAGLIEPQAHYVVSTTQALLRPDQIAAFDQLVGAAAMAAAQTPGVVAMSFAGDPNCGYARTLTVWRDEAAMLEFVVSPAHLAAIEAADQVLVAGRTTHFTIDAAQMPIEWDVALAAIADAPAF